MIRAFFRCLIAASSHAAHIRVQVEGIDQRPDIDFLLRLLALFQNHNAFLIKPAGEILLPAIFPLIAFPEIERIVRPPDKVHPLIRLPGLNHSRVKKMNAFCRRPVESSDKLPALKRNIQVYIHIFRIACHADSERKCIGHGHMGTHAFRKADLYPRLPERLLEITHHIQVSDEFHQTLFGISDPKSHSAVPPVPSSDTVRTFSSAPPSGILQAPSPVLSFCTAGIPSPMHSFGITQTPPP